MVGLGVKANDCAQDCVKIVPSNRAEKLQFAISVRGNSIGRSITSPKGEDIVAAIFGLSFSLVCRFL